MITDSDLLANRITQLQRIVQESFESANNQSKGFALCVLGSQSRHFKFIEKNQFDFSSATIGSIKYGGFPDIAYIGFGIGSRYERDDIPNSDNVIDTFITAIEHLSKRSPHKLQDFAGDDIAVLGVADGIAKLRSWQINMKSSIYNWLIDMIDNPQVMRGSRRMRALAAELLDSRNRLQTTIDENEWDELAIELCLRRTWVKQFQRVDYPDISVQKALIKKLLTEPSPEVGDLDTAVVWLNALNQLVDSYVTNILPSVSDVVRLLEATQTAFKRWCWDNKPRRQNTEPAHWLIDNEYHVQSFLWAVLYPTFRDNLVDEQYLPGFGGVQPRIDLGIINLKLIIEVKILREKANFKKIEEEIAGDLGIYFSDPDRFNRMIVYIYDDCDKHYPELYDTLKDSLKARDKRLEEVIIVRRPSMIPSRKERKTAK